MSSINPNPKDNALLLQWVEAIEAEDHRLNTWEAIFITDIAYRVRKGFTLSPRQEEVLERIYSEKTS